MRSDLRKRAITSHVSFVRFYHFGSLLHLLPLVRRRARINFLLLNDIVEEGYWAVNSLL